MRQLRTWLYCSFALAPLLLLPTSASAQPSLVGNELRANVVEAHDSKKPVVAVAPGGFVVAWENDELGVFARRFSPTGATLDGEIAVAPNARLASIPGAGPVTYNREPALVIQADGSFLVFWAEERAYLVSYPFLEHRQITSRRILGQRFTPSGVAVGSPIRVSETSPAWAGTPAAALQGRTGIVVAWNAELDGDNPASAAATGIYARRLNLSGAPVSASVRVQAGDVATVKRPAVAMSGQGKFLVSWEGCCDDGDGNGVFARLYDAAGSALSAAVQVNSTTAGSQRRPAVAASGSSFLVAWQGRAGSPQDAHIFARKVNSNGVPSGAEIQVSTGERGGNAQIAPALATTPDGGFLAAWVDFNANFPLGVFVRALDGRGNPVSEEVKVNAGQAGYQFQCSLAADRLGHYVAAYEAFAASELGASARRLSMAGAASTSQDLASR
ncbi:MAG: hypothetical protein U0002_21865 [Thermoanaerobaculia bacterium]